MCGHGLLPLTFPLMLFSIKMEQEETWLGFQDSVTNEESIPINLPYLFWPGLLQRFDINKIKARIILSWLCNISCKSTLNGEFLPSPVNSHSWWKHFRIEPDKESEMCRVLFLLIVKRQWIFSCSEMVKGWNLPSMDYGHTNMFSLETPLFLWIKWRCWY